MTNAKGFGVTTGELQRLLVTVGENATLLPDVSAEVATLEGALKDAAAAQKLQDDIKGDLQVATEKVKEALSRARDAGMQIRNAARFKLGARNPKLVSFQVTPLRNRGKGKTQKLTKKEQAALLKQENEKLKKELELMQSKEVSPAPPAA